MSKKGFIQFLLLLLMATAIAWWLSKEQASHQYHTFLSLESAATKPIDHVLELDLSTSNLARFPDQLLEYKYLRVLNLNGYLSVSGHELLDDIYRSYSYASLEDSIKIAIYNKKNKGNQLEFLPEAIGDFELLEVLSIDNNRLTTLPKNSCLWSNLKQLSLAGNLLTMIPPCLGQLLKLETINLSDNRLTSIPTTIQQLSQLKELYLSKNQLTTFPLATSLYLLKSLQQLELNHNSFVEFPIGVLHLPSLTSLEIAHNQLTMLPNNLEGLRELEWLDLRGNNFLEAERLRIRKALPRTRIVFE